MHLLTASTSFKGRYSAKSTFTFPIHTITLQVSLMPYFFLFLILNSSSLPSYSLYRRCPRLLITLFAPPLFYFYFSVLLDFFWHIGCRNAYSTHHEGKTFPIPLSNNVLMGKRIARILTITKIHILLSSTKPCTCREFGDKLWLMESSAKCPRLTAGCSQRMQLVEIWKTLIASGSKQHNTSLSFSTCSKTFWNHTVSTLNLGKVICI